MLITGGSANYRQQVAHLTMRLRIATGVCLIQRKANVLVYLHMCAKCSRKETIFIIANCDSKLSLCSTEIMPQDKNMFENAQKKSFNWKIRSKI